MSVFRTTPFIKILLPMDTITTAMMEMAFESPTLLIMTKTKMTTMVTVILMVPQWRLMLT
jgi:hypothetical protein